MLVHSHNLQSGQAVQVIACKNLLVRSILPGSLIHGPRGGIEIWHDPPAVEVQLPPLPELSM